MQINNTPQCPKTQSTSFGMALKISPKAQKALEEASMETIEKLGKIGEELKDTKYYDLEIGENLAPRINSVYANAYIAPFRPNGKPYDEFLSIKTTWDGTELGDLKRGKEYHTAIKFANQEEAIKAYEKLKSQHSDLDRAAELTKMLDKREIEKAVEEAGKKDYKEAVKDAAADLMKKFGVKES